MNRILVPTSIDRGLGFGKAVQFAVAMAKESGCEIIKLEAHAKSNLDWSVLENAWGSRAVKDLQKGRGVSVQNATQRFRLSTERTRSSERSGPAIALWLDHNYLARLLEANQFSGFVIYLPLTTQDEQWALSEGMFDSTDSLSTT